MIDKRRHYVLVVDTETANTLTETDENGKTRMDMNSRRSKPLLFLESFPMSMLRSSTATMLSRLASFPPVTVFSSRVLTAHM